MLLEKKKFVPLLIFFFFFRMFYFSTMISTLLIMTNDANSSTYQRNGQPWVRHSGLDNDILAFFIQGLSLVDVGLCCCFFLTIYFTTMSMTRRARNMAENMGETP